MKKLLKVLFTIIVILVVIVVAAFAYLNLVYLPQKVKSVGTAYLEQKTKGLIKAESIQYIPFKGVRLKNITTSPKVKGPPLTIDKLYFSINLWPLIIRRDLDFRLDIYPPRMKRPIVFSGLYQIEQRNLDMNFKIRNKLFIQDQTIVGKLSVLIDKEEKSDIGLNISSRDLNVQGTFFIKDKDLRIEKFSGKILDSTFDFIGDVQNLADPSLNIYGDLDISLAGLKNLNPKYTKILNKLNMDGRCLGKIYIASKASDPEIGLKMSASQIKIDKSKIENLSIISKIQNKKVSLTKFYAKLYGGEINLQGTCRLKSKDFPANLNLNIFNLELNKIIRDITGKDTPVHGRLFSLGQLQAPLKDPKDVEGKVWASVSGSNILQLNIFKGIVDVLRLTPLRLPELHKVEFKEASGNFLIAKRAIRSDDLKIVSDTITIHYKGYMDFDGNLGCDVQPSFPQKFLQTAPDIANILGIFIDPAGNFLGEIKMKGNIKKPRYSFKPISVDKLFRKGIEKGFKELFKFKKREQENQ